jgi:hypothetical protein
MESDLASTLEYDQGVFSTIISADLQALNAPSLGIQDRDRFNV